MPQRDDPTVSADKKTIGIDGRSIFLLDGVGAVVSVLLLGVVLPALQPWIGMPLRVLHLLALIPILYAVYSLCCYWLVDHRNPRWLLAIMAANTLYCVLTAILVTVHVGEMTRLGIVYFVADALVIAGVVAFEGVILRRHVLKR